MFDQSGPVGRAGYEHAKVLLRERQRKLHAIEQKHQQQKIARDKYLSCRLSLLQGISELSSILLNDPDRTPEQNLDE
jgi:hypothetical protein